VKSRNRSHTAYANDGLVGSAVSEFLSLSTWPLVSWINVMGGPQLAPPSVERLTSIALAPKPPSERSGWKAKVMK
jgi:hypothetical protein